MQTWLVSRKGICKCMECSFEKHEYKTRTRINRAIYKCLECGWLMCRLHAEDHFKPTACHKSIRR